MKRDLVSEVDGLKKAVEELKELIAGTTGKTEKLEEGKPRGGKGHIIKCMEIPGSDDFKAKLSKSPEIAGVLDMLEDKCINDGGDGRIAYAGVYSTGGRQSTWTSDGKKVEDLLSLVENGMAQKVLDCIGNSERLGILLKLLKKPMTVAQLVEQCGYNSTGQVYHHLNQLLTVDLVYDAAKDEGKGFYAVKPQRIQGIIMLLAGIDDMLDTHYSKAD